MHDLSNRLNEFLASLLDTEDGLPQACREFSLAGKKLRARLLFASAAPVPLDFEDAVVRTAAAIELVHAASLIHDDIVDQCDERRGQPALHRVLGTATAIRAGTSLVHLALRILGDLPECVRLRVAETGQALARGQFLEILHAQDLAVSADERVSIVKHKTASVFGLACELGSRISGASPPESAPYRRFGEAFGMLFQIADDVDDIFATYGEQGRPPATDLRCAVMSLPIVLALQSEARTEMMRLIDDRVADDHRRVDACRALLQSSGALVRAHSVAVRYAEQARESLVDIPLVRSRWMAELVDTTLGRVSRFADGAHSHPEAQP